MPSSRNRVHIEIPRDLHAELAEHAHARGQPTAVAATRAIAAYLAEQKRQADLAHLTLQHRTEQMEATQ